LTSKPATAAAVAYVYVQTTKGVNAYDASSTGKLTLISGSPFADTGQMEGVNGKYLISVGTDYLHTFALESNGAVGKQAAEINTQDYAGSECGNTSGNGAVLDHTGQYFYVALDSFGSIGNCAAWQSYEVLSNGDLRYLGDVLAGSSSDGWATPTTVPTISSNDLFGYGIFSSSAEGTEFNQTAIVGFTRASNGLLVTTENFSETDPAGNPAMIGGLNFTAGGWYPDLVRTDSAGHLAALLFESAPLVGPFDPPVLTSPQLASYTVGSKGWISSSNTWEQMPTPAIPGITSMTMSPSGKLLALAGSPGLQIFHFNGAAPVTNFSTTLLPTQTIDQLGWDNSNHLFALSYASGQLYVYTVTPTEISEVAGSPYSVPNAYGVKGLIVVPK
jgi:hypothetical protein